MCGCMVGCGMVLASVEDMGSWGLLPMLLLCAVAGRNMDALLEAVEGRGGAR